ncbi:unnamed protein product [Closterium sp. NIES-53]
MVGPEERGGRGASGSGDAQAQGQPRDSAMALMQPSLGPSRDEPKVFGLDKFNGDNFTEWSFKMENIFDHYDLLEVMEGTEKRSEIDPEKSPWVRKSAQGYLLLGQALESNQIRHIKPFQREPEKGPKAWAALKGVHASATAAVAVVLERQMAALRIEEDEAVEEGSHGPGSSSTSIVTCPAFRLTPSIADLSLFLRTDTSLPPFYVLVARRTITLTESDLVHQDLQRFGFQFSSRKPTPLSTDHSLSALPSDESVEPSGPYPELVGCLMYLMTCTRPDLAYPLSLLARYVASGRHRKVHLDAAKRILHYLCNTLGMGLVLGGRGPVVLTSHADASWADDLATQRSLHLQPWFRLCFLAVYPLLFGSEFQL